MFWRLAPLHFRVGVLCCFSEFSWLPNRPRTLCNDFVSYKWIKLVSCTFVFCSYISARQFVVCFLRSLCLVRRMSIALTIFRDFQPVAGMTARCAPAGVLTALFSGSARV